MENDKISPQNLFLSRGNKIHDKNKSSEKETSSLNNNILSYGSLIAIGFDYYDLAPVTTLTYDSDQEKKKLREINKMCAEKQASKKNKLLNISSRRKSDILESSVNQNLSSNQNINTNNFGISKRNQSRSPYRGPRLSGILSANYKEEKRRNSSLNQKLSSSSINKFPSEKNLDFTLKPTNRKTSSKHTIQGSLSEQKIKSKKFHSFSERTYLFTKGCFSNQCIFYKYSDIQDILLNYKNSLFRVIPSGEYESKAKLKKCIKNISKSKKEEQMKEINYNNSKDLFAKYKQEILTNHENFLKTITKRSPLNFDDSVHLVHISTGKFLKFKKNPEDLKIYLKLSKQPCKHTVFRIKPGFNYQTEFSTNVFYNLTINIACGDKITNREMYLSNPNLKMNKQYSNFLELFNETNNKENTLGAGEINKNKVLENLIKPVSKVDGLESILHSLNTVNYGNYGNQVNHGYHINQTNTFLQETSARNYLLNPEEDKEMQLQQGNNKQLLNRIQTRTSIYNQNKKTSISFIKEDSSKLKFYKYLENPVIADDKSYNRWKLFQYSNNFEEDDKYLNNFDMFWIQNCEKDVYIVAVDDEYSTSKEVKEQNKLDDEKEVNSNRNNKLSQSNKKPEKVENSEKFKFLGININYASDSSTGNPVIGNFNQNSSFGNEDTENFNFFNKPVDVEENYPVILKKNTNLKYSSIVGQNKINLINEEEETTFFRRYSSLINTHQPVSSNNLPQNQASSHTTSNNFNNQLISNSLNFFSYDHLTFASNQKMNMAIKFSELNEHNSPFGIFAFEPVTKDFIKENNFMINLPPSVGPISYKNLFRIRNVLTNKIVTIEYNETIPLFGNRLKMVNFSEIKNIEDCLFTLEQADKKEKLKSENNDNYPDYHNKSSTSFNELSNASLIKKSDMIRIKSKKFKSFLAIRSLNDNKVILMLTKNLSDLTIFKLDYLSTEDKILVNFFDQLNCILDFTYTYYSKIKYSQNQLPGQSQQNLIHIPVPVHIQKIDINVLRNVSTGRSKYFENLDVIEPNDIEESIQYVKLKNMLEKLKKLIKEYRTNINNEITHKVDIIKNIKEFNIIEKLVKIILSIWFKINLDQLNIGEHHHKADIVEMKSHRSNLNTGNTGNALNASIFLNNDYQQDFRNILENNINEKLALKIECTNLMLKILKITYELDNTTILYLQNYIHLFFKFAGKLDQCTKFLIFILRNNNALLIKLFSNIQNHQTLLEIRESVMSLFYDKYNLYISDNYDSVILFIDLINIMLISNDEPFKPFYNDILVHSNLFVEFYDEDQKKKLIKPKMGMTFLVDFELKDGRIYFKSKYFPEDEEENVKINKSEDQNLKEENKEHPKDSKLEIQEEDIYFNKTFKSKQNQISSENKMRHGVEFLLEEKEEKVETSLEKNLNRSKKESEYFENVKSNINDELNSSKLIQEKQNPEFKSYEINFQDYHSHEVGISRQNCIKMISQNIIFFSNVALNDERFKLYLKKIFKINVITQYLSGVLTDDKGETSKFNLPDEIKCALIRMINYLFIKKKEDKIENINLCRIINDDDDKLTSQIPSSPVNKNLQIIQVNQPNNASLEQNQLSDSFLNPIEKIMNNVEEKLMDHTSKKNTLSFSFLLQIVESCQYIIRHIYYEYTEKNLDFNLLSVKGTLYKFMSLLLVLLEDFMNNNSQSSNSLIYRLRSKNSSNMLNLNLNTSNNQLNKNLSDEAREVLLQILKNDKLSLESIAGNVYIPSKEGTSISNNISAINQNSPYLRLYDTVKRKLVSSLIAVDKFNNKISTALNDNYRKSTLNFHYFKSSTKEDPASSSMKNNNQPQNMFSNNVNSNINNKFKKKIYQNSKEIKFEIIKKICATFVEFLKFVESGYVNHIEKNIINLIKETEKNLDFANMINLMNKNDLINKKIFKFNEITSELDFMKYLDEFAIYHGNKKKEIKQLSDIYLITDKKKLKGNSEEEKLEIPRPKEQENRISNIFFECIENLEKMDMKEAVFEILYRMNSQKMILFENISNLVILSNPDDIRKYGQLKIHFWNLHLEICNLFSTSDKDDGIKIFIKNFQKILNKTIKILYDKTKIKLECEDMEIYMPNDDYPRIENSRKQNKPNEKEKRSKVISRLEIREVPSASGRMRRGKSEYVANKDISDDQKKRSIKRKIREKDGSKDLEISIPKDRIDSNSMESNNRKMLSPNFRNQEYRQNNNINFINKPEDFFIKDSSPQRIRFVQYILKNLNLAPIMIKFISRVNEIISHKIIHGIEVSSTNNHLKYDTNETSKNLTTGAGSTEFFNNIQDVLENIYNLLALFVKHNPKHKFILEEDIETILFPIYLKGSLNRKVRISLSNFILEFLKDFKLSDLNNNEKFIEMMSDLMNDIDWKKDKDLIPYWVEILKVILRANSMDIDDRLINCLDTIKKCLISELVNLGNKKTNKQMTDNELISLKEILYLLIYLKKLNLEDYENKIKFIFPIAEVMAVLDCMKIEENFNMRKGNKGLNLHHNSQIKPSEITSKKPNGQIPSPSNILGKILSDPSSQSQIAHTEIYVQVPYEILNITVDFLFENFHIYKSEFSNSKQNFKKLENNLHYFYNKFRNELGPKSKILYLLESNLIKSQENKDSNNKNEYINDEKKPIFEKSRHVEKSNIPAKNRSPKNETKNKNFQTQPQTYPNEPEEYLLHLNTFIGSSIPKLHTIVNELCYQENAKKSVKENLNKIISLSDSLYYTLSEKLKKFGDNDFLKIEFLFEKTFLKNLDLNEIIVIANMHENNLPHLNELLKLYNSISTNINFPQLEKIAVNNRQRRETVRKSIVTFQTYGTSNFIPYNENKKIHLPFHVNYDSLFEYDTSLWNEIREILNTPQAIMEYMSENIFLNHNHNALFFQKINLNINKEREKFIISSINYIKCFEEILEDEKDYSSHSNYNPSENLNNSQLPSSVNLSSTGMNHYQQFLKTITSIFSHYIDKNDKIKTHLHFYFWVLISFMKFNIKIGKFQDVPISINKEIISSSKFSNIIVKILRRKNLKTIDYSISLIIKFYTTFLHGLDDKNKIKFYEFLIHNEESENFFKIIKNVFQSFKSILMKDHLSNKSLQRNSKFKNVNTNMQNSLFNLTKNVNFDITKYENLINPYEETVNLISFLMENSTHGNVMKDYLRFQYNNTKSHNFISILASILECFLQDSKTLKESSSQLNFSFTDSKLKHSDSNIAKANKENGSQLGQQQMPTNTNSSNQTLPNENNTPILFKKAYEYQQDRRRLISTYYSTVIKIIESLTKCCEGPSFENQNALISDTKLLEFVSSILFKVSYRNKLFNFSGTNYLQKNSGVNPNLVPSGSILNNFNNSQNLSNKNFDGSDNMTECKFINLSRKKTAYIKYKLLILLMSFVEGRKKNDKIYEKIIKYMDIDSLSSVMTETIKEILLERNLSVEIPSLENLVMVDDIYQRFEKITFDNPNKDENRKFIIFEIGTFVYIILNVFYENVNKTKADPFVKTIREIKKTLTNKRKVVEKVHLLTNTFNYFKKIYSILKRIYLYIFCCICIRKKKPRNEDEYEFTAYEKEKQLFKKSYEFYFKYTPNIEIIFCNQIISYYIKLYPMCQYLSPEMKEEFQNNVDRTNTKSKLTYLFKNLYYYKDALEHTQKLEEFFKKAKIIDLYVNQYLFYKDFSFIVTVLINLLIITSYFRTDKDNLSFELSFLYVNDPDRIKITNNVMYILTFIQLILSILIFINYLVKNMPKYTYSEKVISRNTCKKIGRFFYRLLADGNFLYHSSYLLFSIVGFYNKYYFLFAYHLLETARRSSTLTNLLLAIWNPRKQLIVTLFLFILFEYYFIIFIYLYMYDNLQDDSCYSFDRCFFTIGDNAYKNSNGIINFLLESKYKSEFFLGGRFWLDNLFCIVLIMLILQMMAGIIIDNFSALRENQQLIHEDRYNVCYICGLHKNELNKLYGNEEGYTEHIKLDHYYWNYMFLIFNLIKKDPKKLSGVDLFIYNNFENQNFSWIPFETCKKKVEDNKQISLADE